MYQFFTQFLIDRPLNYFEYFIITNIIVMNNLMISLV